MSASTSDGTLVSLFGLDPKNYDAHPLHSRERTFTETNCYTDIWIELLHSRGDEPLAVMGTTLQVDFEGDQWTFVKPQPEDLLLLYGIDAHEMQPYRPLPLQLSEQIAQGRTMTIEVDSFYLPSTRATTYHTAHVKTGIAIEAIDLEGERLHYYHSTGLNELAGEDFRGLFRIPGGYVDGVLPPYVELIRFDAGPTLRGEELRSAARSLLARHLAARPAENPFLTFGPRLEHELPRLLESDLAAYHAYAFATARMIGAAFEIAASHVDWTLGEAAQSASDGLRRIVEGAKFLTFKLARRRPFDVIAAMSEIAAAWDESMARLDELVG